MPKKAIILGAGPAGLAVARELLQHTDIQPILLEAANEPDDAAATDADPLPDYLTGLHPQLRRRFRRLRRIRIYLSRLWARLFPCPERNLEDTSDVTQRIEERGGKILHHQCIYAIYTVPHAICSVHVIDSLTGEMSLYAADYFYSTIPIRDLIRVFQAPVPEEVRDVADRLFYQDLIKVDVELSQIAMPHSGTIEYSQMQVSGDHLYVIGEGLTISRVRLCDDDDENKGSARLVMEYCCTRGDDFWRNDNAAIRRLAIDELEQMGLATSNDIMAIRVRRLEQAIQVYAGSYARLHSVKSYTKSFQNLFLIDRDSMSVMT
jgi:protoporphyrinogen oxidase